MGENQKIRTSQCPKIGKTSKTRKTVKESRKLKRGWSLTDHINHRIKQNEQSLNKHNEFLPTAMKKKLANPLANPSHRQLNQMMSHQKLNGSVSCNPTRTTYRNR